MEINVSYFGVLHWQQWQPAASVPDICIINEQLTNKVQIFVRKNKCTGLCQPQNLSYGKSNEFRQDHGWKSWFCGIVIYPSYENILIKRWKF